ncbi:MAG: hypothetical protein ACJ705_02865 [Nitrososphaeraceae archaeon]
MSSANEPSDEEVRQFESGIMLVLCRRHRIKAGNGEPTDYNIEEFRNEHYAGFTDIMYFKRMLERLSILNNKEIEVDGDIVRVTKDSIDKCKEYDPTFREDL